MEHDDHSPSAPAAARPRAEALERRAMLARVTATLTGESADPVHFGRYLVVRRIGTGGMGSVYEAYDPKLERKVAIKLVRGSSAAVLEEARALARLSHPHVVTVHEVEVNDDGLFIVMELVRGTALDRWLTDAPREPQAIVDAFLQAGRGLAAAHAQGIVHRDFKPSNALVGDDGRVRVVDFGLARPEGMPGGQDTVSGTPAYMAPEQHDGARVDARADQYAYCVSLLEALSGERPFRGKSPAAIALKKVEGVPTLPPNLAAPVRTVLSRGLAPRPEDRFVSMAELLAELDPAPRRRRAAALGAAGVAALLAAWAWVRPPDGNECSADSRTAEVWSEDREAAIEAAFEATSLPFAADAADVVTQKLDTYVEGWGDAYVDACEATQVRGDQSQAVLDLRVTCLESRRRELDALVTVLEGADAAVVRNAVEAVDGLGAVETCSDLEYLRGGVEPPPPDLVDSIEQQERRLVEAAALRAAGRFDAALAIASDVDETVISVDYAPLQTAAALERGLCADALGDHEGAQGYLHRAWLSALASRDDERAIEAATALVHTIGWGLARTDEGLGWADNAQALFVRSGASPAAEARLAQARADVFQQAGRPDDALEAQRRALQIWTEIRGGRDLAVARAHHGVGRALTLKGQYAEAVESYGRALSIFEDRLAPTHPSVAGVLDSMGSARFEQGQHAEALELYERALEIRRRSLPSQHREIGANLNNVGDSLRALGRYPEARERFEQAQEVLDAALGPKHPHVGVVVGNLGNIYWYEENYAAAGEQYAKAREIFVDAFGPEHINVAVFTDNIARVLAEDGKLEEATAEHRRALAILVGALGTDHPQTIGVRLALGSVLTERRELETARIELEAVLESCDRAEVDPLTRAQVLATLGQAEYLAGVDGAVERIAQARRIYAETSDPAHDNVGDLDAWAEENGVLIPK